MTYNPETLSFEIPNTDTVYVSGLPSDCSEDELGVYFGSIGIIKIDKKNKRQKIWLYRDKSTGNLKGDGTITYEDPFSAGSAVKWFNNKEWKGSTLHVSLAQKKNTGGDWGVSDAGGGNVSRTSRVQDRGGSGYGVRSEADDEPHKEEDNNMPPPANVAPGRAKESRTGDWVCAKCSNTNFAFRQKCHKCQAPRTSASQKAGAVSDAGASGRPKVVAAPQGPAGLFAPDDWACPSCGNVNWARRNTCNLCHTSKPGTTDTKREGQAGGFKELDEAEIEEARRRRKEYEDNDGEMYDDFGRLKKKYRAGADDRMQREQAALARLRGDYDPSSVEHQDPRSSREERSRGDSGSGRDRDKDRDRERGQAEDRHKEKSRSGEQERGGDRDGEKRGDRDRKRQDRDRGEQDRDYDQGGRGRGDRDYGQGGQGRGDRDYDQGTRGGGGRGYGQGGRGRGDPDRERGGRGDRDRGRDDSYREAGRHDRGGARDGPPRDRYI